MMALQFLQHHLNALHVMAVFVRVGVPRPTARLIARWWEGVFHPLLYPPIGALIPVRVPAAARLPFPYRRLYE
ncbi:MAG TPA: hypothetical protein VLT62_30935 [Candidatus Methylomirabilis sp.]|nr:hypothetical protein [Candidatus Methylomirabilis sp.]